MLESRISTDTGSFLQQDRSGYVTVGALALQNAMMGFANIYYIQCFVYRPSPSYLILLYAFPYFSRTLRLPPGSLTTPSARNPSFR